jgi:glucose 1-dehydrogenase
MMREVVERFGRLDILVNNAGSPGHRPGRRLRPRHRQQDSRDQLTARRCAPGRRSGIPVAARAAARSSTIRACTRSIPKPDYLAYAMSKAGLGHLTKTLALEFASRGIRVNAVGPGAVVTDINSAWKDDPEKRGAVERHIPMGFAAAPEQIAPVFAFLASDEAIYITGQTLFACGGLTLYGDFKENWSS